MAHIGEELEQYRKGNHLKQPEMAKALGVSVRTYQGIEETGIIKKEAVADKVRKLLGEKEQIIAENNTQNGEGNKQDATPDSFIKVLDLLARNHTTLVEAHKIAVEANRTAAEANKIVVEANKLHAKNQETILNRLGNPERGVRGTLSATDEIFARIKVVLAMIGSGKRPWKNEDEALEALDKLVPWRGLEDH